MGHGSRWGHLWEGDSEAVPTSPSLFPDMLELAHEAVIHEGRVQPASLGECLSLHSSRAMRSTDGLSTVCMAMPLRVKEL